MKMLNINEKMNLYDNLTGLQKKIRRIYIICPVVGVIITAVFAFLLGGLHPMLLMIIFASFVLTSVIASKNKKEYSTVYKNLLVREALENTFTDFQFFPSLGISKNEIIFTDMMQMGNRYYCEDYVKGKYKEVPFEQSDVCIQNVTHTGKTTNTVTYFRGRWMIFNFNKNFRCDLQVREKGFSYSKRKGGLFTPDDEKMEKIELEDIDFNNRFDVRGQNIQEAFYLLTPQIIEAMHNLSEQTSGRIMFCFVRNKLHVAVNNGVNSF